MSSSESEKDYEKISKRKRKRDDYEKYKDRRERSYDKYEKHERRRKDEKSRKKRKRSSSYSKSRSSSGSNSSRRESSSSKSRKHKNKNDKKQKYERRKRKYDDEIEELKDREVKKKMEIEHKRKMDEEKNLKDKKLLEEKSKPKEKVLTEEEKKELKKQTRLARARALALIESAEEKKSDVSNNKNVIEDFLEKDKDETEEFLKSDRDIKLMDEIEKYEQGSDNEKRISLGEPTIEESQKNENEFQTIFPIVNKKTPKIPQLPKEFLSEKETSRIIKESKSAIPNKPSKIEPIPLEEEEDPLDAFMKTIEKEATLQEYQVIQYLSNESLQKRYDEIAEKDDKENLDIENVEKKEGGYSNKAITLEDILNTNKQIDVEMENIETSEKIENQATNDEDDEEFHKVFIETLKNQKVPEFDPFYGYSYPDEKKDSIIYQEDFSEFLKEDFFLNTEETWQAIKRNAEKAKELKIVNHAQINYEPFRKNFYIETKEIANMTEEQLLKFRKEHGDIKVRGKNIPRPIFNWYQCGLSEKIIAVLEKKEFKEPFPIQCQAIPCIMSGRDIIGIAETGSGKTLAYVLPMLRHVMDQRKIKEGEGPIGLIMAPTRELATQIHSVIKPFAKILNINAACVYGGAGIGSQISELRRGAEIVVCTPGRMIEMLCLSNGKITNLQRVRLI